MKKTALLLALLLAAASPVSGALAEQADAGQTAVQTQPQYQVLERGAEGDDVQALMQRLADLGYYSSDVDDEFGPGMARAVKLFNARCGLDGGETATVQMQERAFAADAPVYDVMPPAITAVALEQYEGKPIMSISVQNPQEDDITFLSVIYRCYGADGAQIFATASDVSALGSEPKFAKYRDISVECGQALDLREVAAFDLSAYPGVSRVEAALYCYQAGSEMLIVPERYFVWVSSDGQNTGEAVSQAAIKQLNRTAEQDGLATRFSLGAKTEYVFAVESAHYGLPVGLYLKEVIPDGICARAGLQAGDVITSVAGVAMDFEEALYIVKAQMEPDTEYALEYVRAGQTAATTISWSESAADAGDAEGADAE